MIFKQRIYKLTFDYSILIIFKMVKFWITLLFLTSFLGYTSQLIIKSSNRDHIKPSNVGRIINGRNASITEVPYLVQILVDRNSLPLCGGILLGPKKVVTAAHCAYNISDNR